MSNGSPDDIRLKYLLEKYLANSCSQEELDMLLASVSENAGSAALRLTLEACWERVRGEKHSPEVDAAALYQAILQQEGEFGRKRRLRRRRLARYRAVTLASVLAIVIAWGVLLMLRPRPSALVKPLVATHSRFKNDVQPGGNKAVLVLANGQSIVLDSANNGTLAMQGGIKVVKLGNGQLVYRAAQGNQDSAPVYNTISTPRGGQYELVLQDGTRVWLNAESSVRYPTVFTGKYRSVELSGEAYFEVAPRASNPFKIYMLNQPPGAEKNRKEIDVLGTKFNVMAYEEEKVIRTTLLEGAIQVGDESGKDLMKPGQQAEWQPGSGVRITDDADIDAAVAWKNGFFSFDRSDIRTIMRQLSRWYDLKVTYKDGGKAKMFWGGIQKDLPLSDVLRILEKSGVEFSIDGKNVIVNM
jgi:ferric-dicitrate binding protein FerR (iron transport regulator)